MKQITAILILILFSLSCTEDKNNYKIISQNRTVSKDKCEINIFYPKIKGIKSKVNAEKINKLLYGYPDYKYYLNICDEGKIKVKTEYGILMKTDSLLCFEFRTLLNYDNGGKNTIYQSIALNPNREGEIYVDLEKIAFNSDRGLIYPHIKKHDSVHKTNINLLAYEKGSNYFITLGITSKNLIVYAGGEGEAEGYEKIEIPLTQLK